MPERAEMPPSLAGDMPAPSAELAIMIIWGRAFMLSMPPKRRRAFMRSVVETMAELEETANVVRLRGREHDAAVAMTRRQARAWVRAALAGYFQLDALRK